MKSVTETLTESDSGWHQDQYGYVLPLAEHVGQDIEVRLETLLFGQFYLGVYHNSDNDGEPFASPRLIGAKVPVRPGGGTDLLVADRPVIVCLCGSTRFWRTFQEASLRETLAGKIVLSIGAASGTDADHFGNLAREDYDRVKGTLDELHLRKIDLADEVLILNVDGYIGESTARELAYARAMGKRVRYWETAEVVSL